MPDLDQTIEGTPAGLTCDVLCSDPRWEGISGLDRIRLLVGDAIADAGRLNEPLEVAVALGSDAEVQQLNLSYRGLDKPTNVLSFPQAAGALPRMLGDVIVAFETCSREAEAMGIPLSDHACHLALHGLLHLLGHDHGEEREATVMEAIETRLLAARGIADPHAGPLLKGDHD